MALAVVCLGNRTNSKDASRMHLAKLQADPVEFRRTLLIDTDGQHVRFGDAIDDWQAFRWHFDRSHQRHDGLPSLHREH